MTLFDLEERLRRILADHDAQVEDSAILGCPDGGYDTGIDDDVRELLCDVERERLLGGNTELSQ